MTDDDVGELTLVSPPRLTLRLVLGDLPPDVGAGRPVASHLGDVHDVEDRVHISVAADVEAVSVGRSVAFAGRHCDGRRSTPAGEVRLGGKPASVADLDQ